MMMLSVKKEKSVLVRHRFFVFFFLYLVLYHSVIVNRLERWELNDVTYSLYCVDFSYGFASKLLPGAIYNFLLGSYASRTAATIYATVVILLFFAGLAALLEKFMQRMPYEYRRSALLVVLFFLSGAYTFSIYTKWLGMLDTYWLLITLLFFICLEQKRLRFLIPLLYALSLLIHFSALVFFIPLFSIMLLYRISLAEEKRERYSFGILFAVSLVVTLAIFIPLLLNESKMICSMDEFHQKLQEHGTNYSGYYDYAFFRLWQGEAYVHEVVNEMKPSLLKYAYLFYYQIKMNYGLFFADVGHGVITTVGGLLILAPLLCFIFRFHWSRFRQKGKGLLRLCSFFMLAQFPFVFVQGILFGIGLDMTRYLTHGFLTSFICLLIVLYHEKEARIQFFEQLRLVESSLSMKLYFLAYAAITLPPC